MNEMCHFSTKFPVNSFAKMYVNGELEDDYGQGDLVVNVDGGTSRVPAFGGIKNATCSGSDLIYDDKTVDEPGNLSSPVISLCGGKEGSLAKPAQRDQKEEIRSPKCESQSTCL